MGFKNHRVIRGLYYLLKTSFAPSKKCFGGIGKNVTITPPIIIGNPKNVIIGDNVGIGANAFISAVRAKFVVKSNCAIAEGLTVHTGNHARKVGAFITDITESNKPDGFDKDVIIEEDVWIGCNVTLLSGVRIGRGSTIAAGAVVTHNIPPYCIAGGIPAKVIKHYWSLEQIIEHESKLYPEDKRLSKGELIEVLSK